MPSIRTPLLASALLTAAAATVAPAALAQTTSFRCKNDLVNVGDGKASALQKCGKPVARDAFCKPAATTATAVAPAVPALPQPAPSTTVNITVNACETVDEWTYNPGYGQFMTTLRFESGKLVSITYGDRVK